MAEKKSEQETAGCPVGSFFEDLEKAFGKKVPVFWAHDPIET